MDFPLFVASIHEKKNVPVTVLRCEESGAGLFTRYFGLWIKRIFGKNVLIRMLPEVSLSTLQGELETLFLGQQNIYLITHYTQAPRAIKDRFMQLMDEYSGPHTIFIVDQKKNTLQSEKLRVVTSDSYSVEQAQMLLNTFFGIEQSRVQRFFSSGS